jgi:hypothetical protein
MNLMSKVFSSPLAELLLDGSSTTIACDARALFTIKLPRLLLDGLVWELF